MNPPATIIISMLLRLKTYLLHPIFPFPAVSILDTFLLTTFFFLDAVSEEHRNPPRNNTHPHKQPD